MKLSQEIKNQILEDLKNNVLIKDIVSKYNVSRASIFRIKKDLINESIKIEKKNNILNEEILTNNESIEKSNNELNETVSTTTDESNSVLNNTNNINNFDINEFKRELNNEKIEIKQEIESKNDISVISNNKNNVSAISKKSVVNFKKKQEICIEKNDNIMDVIKNVNNGTSIEEIKQIRSLIIIIK
jgi:hypothetical protein